MQSESVVNQLFSPSDHAYKVQDCPPPTLALVRPLQGGVVS